ncbi:excinuclease ABC subunit B [Jannaschia sp. LMIT008]|uniref:excinuclease ABC subunit B n=1 Tax=Jannaschia maritima TaxID=3032585 RepID=UPI0028126DA9|nr:excinuclease ABC subunit B [Jannaschia sp. LMIT008]
MPDHRASFPVRAAGAALLSLPPSAAAAWAFAPDPVCTLSHDGAAAAVVVTFDPALPEYAIAITLADGTWPDAPVFALLFRGGTASTITTDRHVLSDDGRTLTVTDRGFGNVLNGLERNGAAVAAAGTLRVPVSLDGAAGPVRAFRGCPSTALS